MVAREFVFDEFDTFLEFVKGRNLTYKLVEMSGNSIYAHAGGSERLGYRENNIEENRLAEMKKKLQEADFMFGHWITIVA